jgi:hypothetical protein
MKAQYLAVILIFTALLGANSQSTAPGPKIGIVEELRAIKAHNEQLLKSQRERLELLEKTAQEAREARVFAARTSRG